MIVKKHDAIQIQNAAESNLHIYNFDRPELGIVRTEMNGRYPDKGRKINHKCNEIYYVISGTAIVKIEDIEYQISSGDALFIEAGKIYHIEQAKELVMICPTAPNWYQEQEELII